MGSFLGCGWYGCEGEMQVSTLRVTVKLSRFGQNDKSVVMLAKTSSGNGKIKGKSRSFASLRMTAFRGGVFTGGIFTGGIFGDGILPDDGVGGNHQRVA